jgi:hypothetical protein
VIRTAHSAVSVRPFGGVMTVSTPSPGPEPRTAGGRHRAPDDRDDEPSRGFTIVPGPRGAGPGETGPGGAGPGGAARSSVGVPPGAVPVQRGGPAHPRPVDDEAVTEPVHREALLRAGGAAIQPLSVQRAGSPAAPVRPTTPPAEPSRSGMPPRRPAPAHAGPPGRPRLDHRPTVHDLPWRTPAPDRFSTRVGLVAMVVGAVGALVGLAPWSGLLPRVLPSSALGSTPVFSLVGALLGVVALGVGAIAMFRAAGTSRGLLAGVVGACAGAGAILVGLLV